MLPVTPNSPRRFRTHLFYRAAILSLLAALVALQVVELRRDRTTPVEDTRPVRAIENSLSGGSRSGPTPEAADHGLGWVERISPTSFAIDRADFHSMVAAPGELLVDVRIVPFIADGNPMGFRLYGIRPGTRLAALGLENGDVVRAVNDRELTTPDNVLAAYAATASRDTLDLGLLRDGRPLTIRYQVR